jgi:hypothetical protein
MGNKIPLKWAVLAFTAGPFPLFYQAGMEYFKTLILFHGKKLEI